jgi:tetratricopeptide (TPR) repeat protein
MAEAKHAAATDLARARELLERLIQRYPDEEEAYDEMIHAMRDGSLARDSLAFLERWGRAIPGPGSGHFHNHYGYALLERRLFTEAEREFRAYIAVSPDEANPHDSLAELFLLSGRPEEAIAHYGDALRINPLFGSAYFGRAYAHAMRGRFDEALASIAKLEEFGDRSGLSVVAITLASGMMHARVGRYREADGRIAAAMATAQKAGDIVGELEACLFDAALAIERGQTARAREAARRAEQTAARAAAGRLRPRHTELVQLLALAARDPAVSEADFRSREQQRSPDFGIHPAVVLLAHNLPFRDAEARAMAARGDVPAALVAYRRLNEVDITGSRPSMFEPRFVLAEARLADRAGDRRTAHAKYSRFLELWKSADAGLTELEEARRKIAVGR